STESFLNSSRRTTTKTPIQEITRGSDVRASQVPATRIGERQRRADAIAGDPVHGIRHRRLAAAGDGDLLRLPADAQGTAVFEVVRPGARAAALHHERAVPRDRRERGTGVR